MFFQLTGTSISLFEIFKDGGDSHNGGLVVLLMVVAFTSLQTMKEIVFSDCTVPSVIKDTKLGSSKKEAIPSLDKNNEMVSLPYPTWKCISIAISGGIDISKIPGCHLLRQMGSQWGSQKLLQGLVSHELTAYLSDLDFFLNSRKWLYYRKYINQTTLNHTTL